MAAHPTSLVPMAHVADVQRTIEFYKLLEFELHNKLEYGGELKWAYLARGMAQIMFAKSSGPIDSEQQAVLFYLYASKVVPYREQLMAKGIKVSELEYPPYATEGEFRVFDPDGYVLLVGAASQR
ncbi:VOC family protein [Candidatus Korobacter versatilis]|nr:VOC family protein [Candidatus Koribacter versatilis]